MKLPRITLIVSAEELRALWRELCALAFVLLVAAMACGAFE